MTLHVQFMTMIVMVAGGFYLGIALETHRRFAIYWKRRTVFRFVLEILFWLVQIVFLYYILFQTNYGALRAYVFVACLLGFSMYHVLFKKMYQAFLEYMVSLLRMIYRCIRLVIQTVFFRPFVALLHIILACVLCVIQIVVYILRHVFNLVWIPVLWGMGWIYKRLPKNLRKFLNKFSIIYSTIKNTSMKLVNWFNVKRR